MLFRKLLRLAAPAVALLGFGAPALAEAPAFDRSDADPALWVVKDADTTIYLFGTMHALKPDVKWFDDAVADAFADSDELVLEMLAPDPAQMAPILKQQAMYGPGGSLSKALTKEQYDRFAATAATLGIPAQALEPMKPWFAGVTLATAPLPKLGYASDSGVEHVLQAAAAKRGMTQVGLETFAQQMGFFATLSEKDQVAFLMSGVDEMADMETSFAKMEAAWATGDTAAAAALLNDGMEDTPALYDVLLANRNTTWANWIGERMKQPGKVFVAVGAGHLAGPDSVQARLAAKGIAATRIAY